MFAWFPTGSQLLPLLFDHKLKRTSSPALEQSVVLIISPLVSLMVDQVSSLQDCHVAAGILSGNKGVDKKFLASAKDISKGCYRLLYSAPEAILGSEQWKELLLGSGYFYREPSPCMNTVDLYFYGHFYGKIYGKRGACACSEYQASPPPLEGLGTRLMTSLTYTNCVIMFVHPAQAA